MRTPKPKGPIQHIVIIVKENHAFDNYFGRFPGADGDPNLALASDPPSADHPHDHAGWLRRAAGAARDQYDKKNIPNYWRYAQHYTLCDRYFTAVAGPSTPNHLMLIAAVRRSSTTRTIAIRSTSSRPSIFHRSPPTWRRPD